MKKITYEIFFFSQLPFFDMESHPEKLQSRNALDSLVGTTYSKGVFSFYSNPQDRDAGNI